jgi:hypothetical protein
MTFIQELQALLKDPVLEDAPFLILANKTDLPVRKQPPRDSRCLTGRTL